MTPHSTAAVPVWLAAGFTAAFLAAACGGASAPADAGLPVPDASAQLVFDAGVVISPLAATCASASDCASGVCGANGRCCNAACSTDFSCGATSCDLHGQCAYPVGDTPCGSFCAAGSLTQSSCDGKGRCLSGVATPCPPPWGCAVGGTACATSCVDDTNCAANASCNAEGQCLARREVGFCSSNDECSSGICDVQGSGACCAASCATADSVCGATSCDPNSGACVYPPAGGPCGPGHCQGISDSRGRCDGQGSCGAPVSESCPENLACAPDGNSCRTFCLHNVDCASGAFCDTGGQGTTPGACCPPPPGNTLLIDNHNGNDGPCCGSGPGARACATLNRAMGLVREAGAYGATLKAAGFVGAGGTTVPWGMLQSDGNFGDQAAATEHFPVQLGYGVTLDLSGVLIDPETTNPEDTHNCSDVGLCSGAFTIFWVYPFPEEDAGSPVVIRGGNGAEGTTLIHDPGTPAVLVGAAPLQKTATPGIFTCASFNSTPTYLPVQASLQGVTLQTSTNRPSGFLNGCGGLQGALQVAAGGDLSLGPNPVTIVQRYAAGSTFRALDGLFCSGADGFATSVHDVASPNSVLTIGPSSLADPFPNGGIELNIGYGCSVNVASSPQLGTASNASTGEGICYFDRIGASVAYDAGLVFGSSAHPGVIRCMSQFGIDLPGQNDGLNATAGGGTADVQGASIRFNAQAGVHVGAGTFTAEQTQLVDNNLGLWVDGTFSSEFPGTQIGPGAAAVELRIGDVVACNGTQRFVPPPSWFSDLYSEIFPGNAIAYNAGANLVDFDLGPTVQAAGLTWATYAAGAPTEATCTTDCETSTNPTIFPPVPPSVGPNCSCTCAGTACGKFAGNFTVIPDGLDVVQFQGAAVNTAGGSKLAADYCANLAANAKALGLRWP